jgi:DNA-binding transcriptional ArsR family regulator
MDVAVGGELHGASLGECHCGPAGLIGKQRLAYYWAVADVFRALDDETRRLVLDELAARDGQTLFELCSRLTMRHGVSLTRQAISQHLGVLEAAGLITTRRQGRSKFHYFNPEPLADIARRWLPAEQRSDP